MLICDFCGLEQESVVSGVSGRICDECIESLQLEKKEDWTSPPVVPQIKQLKPHEIKEALDAYVVGQDEAKEVLAVEVYNHYKRVFYSKSIEVDLPKSNILLVGPSGSGKTYLLQQLAKALSVPFVIGDATSLTENGYVGKDVESLLQNLLDEAKGNVSLAEKGIIYIDEIDKLAPGASKSGKAKEVGGTGVQQALLTLLEGFTCTLESGEKINTKNILFVCGGAFEGLNRTSRNEASELGFRTQPSDIEHSNSTSEPLSVSDLVQYGMIREFVGRLHVIVELQSLTKEQLMQVIVEPKNSIMKQYVALFEMDGVNLTFDDEAIAYIAKVAHTSGTGARGLKGVISKQLSKLMFELPMREVAPESIVITKSFLTGLNG